jgi:hypothetical protein
MLDEVVFDHSGICKLRFAKCVRTDCKHRSRLKNFPNLRQSGVTEHEWKHFSREQLNGWSDEKLAAARQYADPLHDSSVMVVQCGQVVGGWGETAKKIATFSVRKKNDSQSSAGAFPAL